MEEKKTKALTTNLCAMHSFVFVLFSARQIGFKCNAKPKPKRFECNCRETGRDRAKRRKKWAQAAPKGNNMLCYGFRSGSSSCSRSIVMYIDPFDWMWTGVECQRKSMFEATERQPIHASKTDRSNVNCWVKLSANELQQPTKKNEINFLNCQHCRRHQNRDRGKIKGIKAGGRVKSNQNYLFTGHLKPSFCYDIQTLRMIHLRCFHC